MVQLKAFGRQINPLNFVSLGHMSEETILPLDAPYTVTFYSITVRCTTYKVKRSQTKSALNKINLQYGWPISCVLLDLGIFLIEVTPKTGSLCTFLYPSGPFFFSCCFYYFASRFPSVYIILKNNFPLKASTMKMPLYSSHNGTSFSTNLSGYCC